MIALLAAVLPTPKTRFPSDPTSIVLIVLCVAAFVLALSAAISHFRSSKGGKS